jgi:uncharacterized membrane protein
MARMKWFAGNQPAQGLVLAVLVFVLAYWPGRVGLGWSAAFAGILVLYSAVLIVFRHSGVVEALSSPGRDERTANINMKASAVSLFVVSAFVVGMFLVDLAHGNTGTTPWVVTGAVIGGSYLLSAILFAIRN